MSRDVEPGFGNAYAGSLHALCNAYVDHLLLSHLRSDSPVAASIRNHPGTLIPNAGHYFETLSKQREIYSNHFVAGDVKRAKAAHSVL